MSITKCEFGKINGETIYLYKLDNENGLSSEIITYGGIIRTLEYKGHDVVLGRDTIEEYLNNDGCFGALIGRNSNRIENSEFEIDGKLYKLTPNNGRNNLHGGPDGFNKKIWSAESVDGIEPKLILSLVSPDGDQGFPGEAHIKVTYTLTKENAFEIHYEAQCDQDTLVNLTNHTYFNLNGHNGGNINNHTLVLNSSFYTPNTDELMPYGEILKTEGTPFDFTKGMSFGEGFSSECKQVKKFKGYDHNFVLDGSGYRYCGYALGDKSGIKMELYTDLPAVQIYTHNSTQKERACKNGEFYPVHAGFCLETQVFPNAMKHRHYPGPLLRKGVKYDTMTSFKFI